MNRLAASAVETVPAALTALVLAGSRGLGDPLARYANVSHKALIEIGGQPMLARVVAALARVPRIARIVIVIERPDLVSELGLERIAGGRPLEVHAAAGSPSLSVAQALRELGAPLFVTTADHALLEPEWIEHFLDHAPADADAIAALAPRAAIEAAVPGTRRTWLRFADGAYSGCNLFLFARPPAAAVVRLWREIENERKHPLRMLRRLGFGFALRYALGLLPLGAALARLGALTRSRIAIVELPFGRAAVDVDKPEDLELVRRLLSNKSPLPHAGEGQGEGRA